ncbi:hypothetical protein E2986_13899 [Frieseomelitta varia]|uniref:Uncharacterized protein n=1 Tax=Frieseomelitta varia TaxID=561572 RepID=A0A833W081_9HYME|nr:hypothetical protein E2986_13899 [Frieseomelitta varia]
MANICNRCDLMVPKGCIETSCVPGHHKRRRRTAQRQILISRPSSWLPGGHYHYVCTLTITLLSFLSNGTSTGLLSLKCYKVVYRILYNIVDIDFSQKCPSSRTRHLKTKWTGLARWLGKSSTVAIRELQILHLSTINVQNLTKKTEKKPSVVTVFRPAAGRDRSTFLEDWSDLFSYGVEKLEKLTLFKISDITKIIE